MRIAHLSDLHLGLDAASERAAQLICDTLVDEALDHVVVTGDVTHRGRFSELALFRQIFAPLEGRLVVVPGNHDRLGDDLGDALMPGFRVQTVQRPGLWIVRFNSTGPHNRRWLDGHGLLTAADIADVDAALARAPRGSLRVLAMHHHPLALPDEHIMEKLVTRLGWPNARELPLGQELIESLRGRCDVLLHGHRHVPAELWPFAEGERRLRIYSGGSSTELLRCRIIDAKSAQWLECGDRRAAEPARLLATA